MMFRGVLPFVLLAAAAIGTSASSSSSSSEESEKTSRENSNNNGTCINGTCPAHPDSYPHLVTAAEGGWPGNIVGQPFKKGEDVYCLTRKDGTTTDTSPPCTVGLDWYYFDEEVSDIKRCTVLSKPNSMGNNETHINVECPVDEYEIKMYVDTLSPKCCERYVDNDISMYKSRSGLHFTSWRTPESIVRGIELIEEDYPDLDYSDGSTVLLSYFHYDAMWKESLQLPVRVKKSNKYKHVYKNLKRSHTLTVDDKLQNAYKVRRWEQKEKGSMPFPTTHFTCEEALASESSNEDSIYYIKEKGGTRGEGIVILKRRELESMQQQNRCNNGINIFQEAVTDLATISQKRFDIRFYILTFRGKIYLHQHALMIYMQDAPGSYFDPTNPYVMQKSVTRDLGEDGEGAVIRVYSHEQPEIWEPWMKAIEEGLKKAYPVFDQVLEASLADPMAYQIWGGDAMIRANGEAVFPEFNDWPNVHYGSGDESKSNTGTLLNQNEFGPVVIGGDLEEFYYNFVGRAYADLYSIVLGLENIESDENNKMCKGRVTEVVPPS